MQDKITDDIKQHFAYNLDLTIDFFTLPRETFLQEYPVIDDIQYNNTCTFWLKRIGMIDYILKPIGQIEGIWIGKLCHKRGIEPLDLFILCS